MPEYLFKSNWLDIIIKENLFLLFDFDGTLVPIMKNPKDCYLPDEIRICLDKIKDKVKIGIISGRDLQDLKSKVLVEGIYYSGSHGLQIGGPDIKYINPNAAQLRPYLDKIYSEVINLCEEFPGALIEKKSFSFTLHYRQVESKIRKDLKKTFFQIIKRFDDGRIKILEGKMVYEVLPSIDWNKGMAVSFLLKNMKKEAFPIFIGDDLTDETVFSKIKDKGLTIKVGYSKKTMAMYFLKNQKEVYKFIRMLKEVIDA